MRIFLFGNEMTSRNSDVVCICRFDFKRYVVVLFGSLFEGICTKEKSDWLRTFRFKITRPIKGLLVYFF